MIEKKSFCFPWHELLIRDQLNYWSVVCLLSEVRYWSTKAIHLECGRASEALATRAPTTWGVNHYEIIWFSFVELTALVFPKFTFNMGIQVTGQCLSLSFCEWYFEDLNSDVVFMAFLEYVKCSDCWLLMVC